MTNHALKTKAKTANPPAKTDKPVAGVVTVGKADEVKALCCAIDFLLRRYPAWTGYLPLQIGVNHTIEAIVRNAGIVISSNRCLARAVNSVMNRHTSSLIYLKNLARPSSVRYDIVTGAVVGDVTEEHRNIAASAIRRLQHIAVQAPPT